VERVTVKYDAPEVILDRIVTLNSEIMALTTELEATIRKN
jgi:hypothetical protein